MDIVTCETEKSKKKESVQRDRARNHRGVSRLLPLAKCHQSRLLQHKTKVIKIIPGASLPLLGSAIFSCTGFFRTQLYFGLTPKIN